ncbi:MAG: bifunctional ADP-dependent NAD(P)H-hydrate dehydratase/NAD(P)H-hydrate epimerase [Hyphomicrobium sp.]|nr:MAG: bifunctional ADP-dependent NAD(P)H-hydrate dehydratase/NAD(P)H-hydrate epimerase [Hyphomicrobium sp.]
MTELLTTLEMAEADRLAATSGISPETLMENAGRAVADAVIRRAVRGTTVVVFVGPGHNGGDGFVAARVLIKQGFEVRLAILGDVHALRGDAATMASRYQGEIVQASPEWVRGAGVIVDALYGAGLSRPLSGDAANLVDAINASGVPVISVDVPSGLDGTSGKANGPVVQATECITFFRKKPGHVLLPGRSLCGAVSVADIGIPTTVLDDIAPKVFENSPAVWRENFPRPRLDSHKYQRGHVVVVSGPPDQTGAARLAARGALRAGAGLVTVIGTPAATAINATHLTAIMVQSVSGPRAIDAFLRDARRNAVVIGPGASVGPNTAADVCAILQSSAAVVLDADALTSFSTGLGAADEVRGGFGFLVSTAEDQPSPCMLFRTIAARQAPVVMTPHDGEFKKLFGDMPGCKLDRTRAAAKLSGAIVVLKGPDTVVAAPDGRAVINSNAPPWLATAGSGDVLSGLIAGLMAQGMLAFEAACAGVWLHGAAADAFGPGLIAEDLPESLPRVLRALYEQTTH